MSKFRSLLIDLKLKIKHNKWPFIICIIFWAIGFAYYIGYETDKNIWHLIAITSGIRSPSIVSDFSGFYQLRLNNNEIILSLLDIIILAGELLNTFKNITNLIL